MDTRARATGDPRELGLAQAALAPWWAQPTPPAPERLPRAPGRQRGLRRVGRAPGALRFLRGGGLGPNANPQAKRLRVPGLGGVLELLITEGARGWQLQMTVPMGRAVDNHEWLLQPWELRELYPRLAVLAERGRAAGVAFRPAPNIGYFGPHESTLRNRGAPGAMVWHGCNAGVYALGVEADGSIKGCPSLPTDHYVGGNVRERSLRQIWDDARELRFMRDESPRDLWGFCASCYYAEECRGGCTWTCLLYTSDAADERSRVDLGGRRIFYKTTHRTYTSVCRIE